MQEIIVPNSRGHIHASLSHDLTSEIVDYSSFRAILHFEVCDALSGFFADQNLDLAKLRMGVGFCDHLFKVVGVVGCEDHFPTGSDNPRRLAQKRLLDQSSLPLSLFRPWVREQDVQLVYAPVCQRNGKGVGGIIPQKANVGEALRCRAVGA